MSEITRNEYLSNKGVLGVSPNKGVLGVSPNKGVLEVSPNKGVLEVSPKLEVNQFLSKQFKKLKYFF